MAFLKEDLLLHHYNWKSNQELLFEGQPSRRCFDRYNGDQVLFIINYVAESSRPLSVEEGRKIEELIRTELPLDPKSEISVCRWLESAC